MEFFFGTAQFVVGCITGSKKGFEQQCHLWSERDAGEDLGYGVPTVNWLSSRRVYGLVAALPEVDTKWSDECLYSA